MTKSVAVQHAKDKILFADQSQSILDNLVGLLARVQRGIARTQNAVIRTTSIGIDDSDAWKADLAGMLRRCWPASNLYDSLVEGPDSNHRSRESARLPILGLLGRVARYSGSQVSADCNRTETRPANFVS
jgi:hypothetical protein